MGITGASRGRREAWEQSNSKPTPRGVLGAVLRVPWGPQTTTSPPSLESRSESWGELGGRGQPRWA